MVTFSKVIIIVTLSLAANSTPVVKDATLDSPFDVSTPDDFKWLYDKLDHPNNTKVG